MDQVFGAVDKMLWDAFILYDNLVVSLLLLL